MSAIAGYVTFDTVDNDLEVTLGGAYTEFEFIVSGELNTTSTVRRTSHGVAIGTFQGCTVDCSNGSNHRNYCLNDRIIKVQNYTGSAWVTILEVEFKGATATGAKFNVITANSSLMVLIKART